MITGAGRLPYKAIIHVAGINAFWLATRFSVQQSVRSAMDLVNQHGFASVALPLIGAGTGGFSEARVLALIQEVLQSITSEAAVTIVKFSASQ